jgi:hypothetical protein
MPADAELICHVDVSLGSWFSLLNYLGLRILVTLPHTPTQRASNTALSLCGCPHLETLFMQVLPACRTAPDQGLLAIGVELDVADRTIAVHRLSFPIMVVPLCSVRSVAGDGWRSLKDLAHLAWQQRQLINVLELGPQDSR